MSGWWFKVVCTLVSFVMVAHAGQAVARNRHTEDLRFGRFGTVAVYKPATPPTHAAIFLSGDGGWNSGVVDMARMLVAKEYLVIGVDVPRLMASYGRSHEPCAYPPGDLQMLSQYVQKKLAIKRYLVPMLVGYSSGATLAYAALVQAPPGTFEGAVSLGFCSDLGAKKVFCKGDGLQYKPLPKGKGYDFLPAPWLETPWVALHGKVDKVCDLHQTEAFVQKTGKAKIVTLDRVGHGFGVQRRWQMQMEQAVRDISAAAFLTRARSGVAKAKEAKPSGELEGEVDIGQLELPLVEVNVPRGGPESDYFAVLVSGDGGWAGLDREVAAGLAEAGIPVVGLDSLQYFWTRKAPEETATDFMQISIGYGNFWQRKKVIAIGYSFGADVLPFALSRLPAVLRDKLALTVLISPSAKATFEFKVSDWFGDEAAAKVPTAPVQPEIMKLKDKKLLCFYGKDDKSALCPNLRDVAQVVPLAGSHRLGDARESLVTGILDALGIKAPEDD